jgi:hypothetical protein
MFRPIDRPSSGAIQQYYESQVKWFNKLLKHLILSLHEHNIPCQQRDCPSFSGAISSSLLMLTAGPQDQFSWWRCSRSRLAVCSVSMCPDLWLQVSVSFVHCNHLKTEHTVSLLLLRRHLGSGLRPRSKHEKRTAGSAWETWAVSAADTVCCARREWEIKLSPTFETAPIFNVCPAYAFDTK